nr:DUF933 domain-containing protein [Gammaproteobacteria bacterium]
EDERVAGLRSAVGDAPVVALSAELEVGLQSLEPAEREAYLSESGLGAPGVDRLIRRTYERLGLITFFTFNEKEARAWTVRRGATAPEAAGRVHSDFQEGFIRAETIGFDEFESAGSMRAARDAGRVRSEGADYVVRDGDILLFRARA